MCNYRVWDRESVLAHPYDITLRITSRSLRVMYEGYVNFGGGRGVTGGGGGGEVRERSGGERLFV